MKIDCLKKCQVGDVLHIWPDRYRAISEYIDAPHPERFNGPSGYILVRNMRTFYNTFVLVDDICRITRIIKSR